MKTELVQSLTTNFEAHAKQTETGVEFCFLTPNHFADVGKMVERESSRP
jgi:hypothetical protein